MVTVLYAAFCVPSVMVSRCPLTPATLPRANVAVAKPCAVRTTAEPCTARASRRRPPLRALACLAAPWGDGVLVDAPAGAVRAPGGGMALIPAPAATQHTATSSSRECLRMVDMSFLTSLVGLM